MSFSPAAGLLIALIATAPPLLALGAAPPPEPGAPVVVIAPPWRAAADIVAQAGGVMLRDGRFSNIASSYAPDGDHAAALRASGAWAVLNGDFSRFLCGS
ncbi:MAG: hypothetical protein ACJAVR_000996 [Paracoccaceae bacterium]|jgi:hypothetical protein